MQPSIDYNDNYSDSYREQLRSAFAESKKLGFTRTPFTAETDDVSDDTLAKASRYINQISGFLDIAVRGYWSNSCQTLTSNLFALLNNFGIKADIVVGNVIVNGTDEFETTLESLQQEVNAKNPLQGHQAVHAWITLGGDTIVDAALPPRLAKNYAAPAHFKDLIFIDRALNCSARYKCRYQPILVGSEFFAQTNPLDPMDLLVALRG